MGTSNFSERPSIEPKWLMPTVDVCLALLAFIFAYILRYDLQLIRPVLDPSRAEFAPYIPFALIYMLMLFLTYQSGGLYRNIRGRPLMDEVYIIVNGVTNSTVVLLALFFLLQPTITSRLMLIYVAGLTVILLAVARVFRRYVLAQYRNRGIGVQKVLIVGMGDVGQAVLRVMLARSELGYRVEGYLDDDPERGYADLGRVRGLGTVDNLPDVIRDQGIELVVITLRWTRYNHIMELARICQNLGIEVQVVPDIFQLNLRQLQVENMDGIPLLGMQAAEPFRGTNRILKRVLDVGLTVLLSPLWVPLFGIVAFAIYLEGDGPVFYRQKRVGEDGREFELVKFRSMIPDAEKMQAVMVMESGEDPRHPKLENDPRITKLGKFLRRTSLDELPNLVNVLLGQMSLVGPRPPTPNEVDLYEPWHMQRLQIIPGITGLWQVSGRSDVPFEEMCLLDIYYIENWSLQLDMQILMMTLPRVLFRRGAY